MEPSQEMFYELEHGINDRPFSVWLQEVYRIFSKAKRLLRDITKTILKTRRSEWRNAKIHYIQVGTHGKIARMINLKPRSGPTASKMYPTKPGEAIKPAISIEECKEATILMHTSWMANPPGVQNCHFLDIISDNTGHCGVKVNSRKQFDIKAQWRYLAGVLEERVDAQTAERVKEAHQRLPKLFEQIKTDTVLNYPFKCDCEMKQYIDPKLEIYLERISVKVMERRGQLASPFLSWVVCQKFSQTHT